MQHLIKDFINRLATVGLVRFRSVGRLENPQRLPIVGDLHGLASAGHAFDLERFADQCAEGNRLHHVRHYQQTDAMSIRCPTAPNTKKGASELIGLTEE
jgi:hypothetical protein